MRELDDGEARRHVAARARTSGHSQVYQAGANQYVINLQVACDARQRADGVVEALTHAVGEWKARCKELEEQVGRAKAEGRAEARAELAERLREAERCVMRAQTTLRRADAERARAEVLLIQARSELAYNRRKEERDAERSQGSDYLPARPGLSPERQDSEQFSALMDRADAELDTVREELRLLGQTADVGGAAQVVTGELASPSWTDDRPVPRSRGGRPGAVTVTFRWRRMARFLLRGLITLLTWVLCLLPSSFPMLFVTTMRALAAVDGASDGEIAGLVLGTLLLCGGGVFVAVATALYMLEAFERRRLVNVTTLTGWSGMVMMPVSFVLGFFTPLDWPGPAGAWGQASVSAVVG